MLFVDGQIQGFVFFAVGCHTVQRGVKGAVGHVGGRFVAAVGNTPEVFADGQGAEPGGVIGVVYLYLKISGIGLLHGNRNYRVAAVHGIEQHDDGFRFRINPKSASPLKFFNFLHQFPVIVHVFPNAASVSRNHRMELRNLAGLN